MALSEKVRVLAEGYADLSDEERQAFFSLVTPSDDCIVDDESLALIRNRADDIDSGRVQLFDGEDVLRRLRAA